MLRPRNLQEARAIEIAEHRTERLCVQLESFTKGMRMAAVSMAKFSAALEKVFDRKEDHTDGT